MSSKVEWHGEVLSVQPRIRLLRSFDEQSHSYLGYVLRARGTLGGEAREFVVALGKGAHEKHRFCVGDRVFGNGLPVADPRLETAQLYKASGLKVMARGGVTRAARHLLFSTFLPRWRSTGSGAIGGWPPEATPRSARRASGAARWRWK